MAFWDEASRSIVIRVVYDGLGTAGKTTNIDRIWEQFSAARKGDVYTPEVMRGRTLYFDWLELAAGRVEGLPLRCQIITVPGQLAYVQRRWELLRYPDAIVAVCDSDPGALHRARVAMRFLEKTLATRGMADVPLILQANKQDVEGAIAPHELAQAIGLDPARSKVVAAVAREGHGVRQTLLEAIHAAADRVRAHLGAHGTRGLPGPPEHPEALYERLKAMEDTEELEQGARLADEILNESEPI